MIAIPQLKESILNNIAEGFDNGDYGYYFCSNLRKMANQFGMNVAFNVFDDGNIIVDFDTTDWRDPQSKYYNPNLLFVYTSDGDYLDEATENLNRLIPEKEIEDVYKAFYTRLCRQEIEC